MFKQLFLLPFLSIVLSSQIQTQSTHPQLQYHTLPIYGNASLGYYYVKLFMGAPQSQPQSVIVDTGSGILAVPCTYCQKCNKKHIDPPYNPSKSSFSKELTCESEIRYCQQECKGKSKSQPCPFSIYYAEGSSLEGIMIEDDIKFENYSEGEEIRTYFGCTTKETNLFLTQQANGIFGLAPKRHSDLFDKMVAKHSQYTGEILQFSLCLSSNGGLMTIGGNNHQLHDINTEPIVIAPFNDRKNLYSLSTVTQIRIGSQILHWGKNYGLYGIFIDSGSTFSYFPRDVYRKFENHLNFICNKSQKCKILKGEDSTCYKLEMNENTPLIETTEKFFPSFYFQISGKDIPWSPKKYLLTRNIKNGEVCLGVLSLDRFLLGANWMYDRDIVFNIKNQSVSIYDNIKCHAASPEMGQYNKNSDDSNKPLTQQSSFKDKSQISNFFWVVGVVFFVLAIVLFSLMKVLRAMERRKGKRVNEKTAKGDENELMKPKEDENEVEVEETD